jgi:hypothetical protein
LFEAVVVCNVLMEAERLRNDRLVEGTGDLEGETVRFVSDTRAVADGVPSEQEIKSDFVSVSSEVAVSLNRDAEAVVVMLSVLVGIADSVTLSVPDKLTVGEIDPVAVLVTLRDTLTEPRALDDTVGDCDLDTDGVLVALLDGELVAVLDDETLNDHAPVGEWEIDNEAVRFDADSTAVTVGDRIEAVTVIEIELVTGKVTELRFCERVGVSVRGGVKVGGFVGDFVIVSDGLGTNSTDPVRPMVKLVDGDFEEEKLNE